MARIVCIGEAMIELSRPAGSPDWRMGFGGDTLNTAIHLARGGHQVGYLTALGEDAFSGRMLASLAAEGLDCSLALIHPTRGAGLYAIDVDAAGERSFTYWRDASAARAMFDLPAMAAALEAARRADLLVYSLISLAILPPQGRAALLNFARAFRGSGGKVAFDGNYRPRLWDSAGAARAARDSAIAVADFGLPTWEDEQALSQTPSAADVADHWRRLGCAETIVKLGAAGCLTPQGDILAPEAVLAPVDTSGAGDAFNAGYLGARMNGLTIAEAVRAGHALAGWTIMRPGAIPARDS